MPVFLLVDMRSGQTLAARNDRHRFIPASVTKVMTLFLAFELMAEGRLSRDTTIIMSDATQAEWFRKGSTMFIEQGQEVPLDTILSGIAAISANDASVALAEHVAGSTDAWAEMMNAKAVELGMHDSHFATPNGWPDGGRTFTTARDLEILAGALIRRHPGAYRRYFGLDGFAHNGIALANHDPISRRVEGADGIKTGFTEQAGHTFLGSAERGGTRLVMVLAGVEDYAKRGTLSRQLIEWGFTGFERKTLFRKGQIIGSAALQDGEVDAVDLVAAQDIRIAIPRGGGNTIALSLRYAGPVRAPVSPDRPIAHLRVDIEGMASVGFPLVPARPVQSAGLLQRIVNGFESWIA